MAGKSVEVDDLAKKEEPKQDAVKKDEPRYVTIEDLEKMRQDNEKLNRQLNGISYNLRKIDELSKKFETFQQPEVKTVERVPPKDMDELDLMLEKGDWRTPVKKITRQEFDSWYEERKKIEKEQEVRQRELESSKNDLAESQKIVLEKYKELNDPGSEMAQRFMRVLDKHQSWRSNPQGPLLTMYAMEDELRSEGLLDETSKKIVDKEIVRQARVGATSIPRSSSNSSNHNTLTKEQKEFCDLHGIKYENYLNQIRGQRKKDE